MLDIVAHGTLATIDDDGNPLGTYASYVLDTKARRAPPAGESSVASCHAPNAMLCAVPLY